MEEYTNEMNMITEHHKFYWNGFENEPVKGLNYELSDKKVTHINKTEVLIEYFMSPVKKSPNSKRYELDQRKTEALEAIAKLTHQEKVDYICKGMDANEAINQDDLRRIVKDEVKVILGGEDLSKSFLKDYLEF